MMENGKPRKRRQLSPEEKWEIFLEVTSQEISQADAARKYGVDVQRDHPVAGVGEGRGAGGVRVGEAGAAWRRCRTSSWSCCAPRTTGCRRR